MEGANLSGRRTASEATRAEPGIEENDADAGQGQQTDPRPVSAQPERRWIGWVSTQALAEQRGAFAERCDGHAVAVVSTLGALMLLIWLALEMLIRIGTVFALAGFWPLLPLGQVTR